MANRAPEFSARVLADPTDGEDAAQAALLKVFERVATFDPSRDAVAWVLTIARVRMPHHSSPGAAAKRGRARRHEARRGRNPEALVVERDLEAAVREVIGTLREEDAKAILAAIAGERRVADATFRKRLERALGRLRVAWRAKHGIEMNLLEAAHRAFERRRRAKGFRMAALAAPMFSCRSGVAARPSYPSRPSASSPLPKSSQDCSRGVEAMQAGRWVRASFRESFRSPFPSSIEGAIAPAARLRSASLSSVESFRGR